MNKKEVFYLLIVKKYQKKIFYLLLNKINIFKIFFNKLLILINVIILKFLIDY